MAQPTNLYSKYSLKGDREDLLDKIFNTSPTETPVVTAFGRGAATNVYHEWQRDALASANKDNALIDGDDFSADSLTATERVGNYCQIFAKKPAISRRANVVKKAGRAAELGYQKAKAMLEIKRDMEAAVLSGNAAVAGNTTTASKLGGLGVQNNANTSHGAGGSTAAWTSGAPTVAATAGTGRAFTEALLKTVVQSAYINSGEVPKMVVMSPNHKGVFSAFAGIAVNRYQVGKKEQGRIIGGADVYMSDFGELEIVPHYLMSGATDVHLLNTEYGELCFLDGFRTEQMGKTGDSDKVLITADVTLAIRAPKAFAKVADLTGG
jgi:hypothetical protein